MHVYSSKRVVYTYVCNECLGKDNHPCELTFSPAGDPTDDLKRCPFLLHKYRPNDIAKWRLKDETVILPEIRSLQQHIEALKANLRKAFLNMTSNCAHRYNIFKSLDYNYFICRHKSHHHNKLESTAYCSSDYCPKLREQWPRG